MSLHEHCIHLKNGQLAADTPFHHVSNLVSQAVEHGNIIIHFHGGLVNRDTALESAAPLYTSYKKGNAYPVFFIGNRELSKSCETTLMKFALKSFSVFSGNCSSRLFMASSPKWKEYAAL